MTEGGTIDKSVYHVITLDEPAVKEPLNASIAEGVAYLALEEVSIGLAFS